eukprot:scaffold141191_cov60-Attheya_sp.AAC.2
MKLSTCEGRQSVGGDPKGSRVSGAVNTDPGSGSHPRRGAIHLVKHWIELVPNSSRSIPNNTWLPTGPCEDMPEEVYCTSIECFCILHGHSFGWAVLGDTQWVGSQGKVGSTKPMIGPSKFGSRNLVAQTNPLKRVGRLQIMLEKGYVCVHHSRLRRGIIPRHQYYCFHH